jgi:flagellar protein FliS
MSTRLPFAPASSGSAAGRSVLAYQAVDAQSRSGLGLVVMLYDGAMRFLGEARAAHDAGNLRTRANAISRTLAIVAELQRTLDADRGGEVALELDRLYEYVSRRVVDVTVHGDAGGLDEASRILATLRDAWARASSGPHGATAVTVA